MWGVNKTANVKESCLKESFPFFHFFFSTGISFYWHYHINNVFDLVSTGISEAENFHFIFSKHKGKDLYSIFSAILGK